jgi:acyl-ACP thioesterase
MEKYTKEFIIPYYDTDKNGLLKISALLAYMEETSSFHSDALGIGVEELGKNNYGWMLNRWRARFYKLPKVKEKVIIDTWTSGFDKFYAYREFAVYDINNEPICNATTLWIFLDVEKKKPIRVPKEFNGIYKIVDEKLMHDFADFRDDFTTKEGMDFHVRRSDIDYNQHVNNVKYLDWILETVPEDVYENYQLHELDIQYKKELKLGTTIDSLILEEKDNKNPTYLHKITNRKEINAYGRTEWIPLKKIEI